MNLPNKLTLLRIALVPPFLIALFLPHWWAASASWCNWVAAGIFLLASATDLIDGRYARKHGLVTEFGKLMDPIADKLLTASALIMLSYMDYLHPFETIVFIAREFIISGFRLLAAKKGVIIAADKLGKLKTTLQIVFITMLLLCNEWPFRFLNPYFTIAAQVLALITLGISIISCVQYFLRNKGIIDFHDC